jgi:catechol 2,3-dioxygenase-like lactoylglutathione lyase family enzyme
MKVQFIASFAVIAPDPAVSRKLYLDGLGLPLEQLDEDYYATGEIDGCKHFGVWPLAQAAQACFGTPAWPAEHPVPQASVEFDVGSSDEVADAAAELEQGGHSLLHGSRVEPWGQTVARMLSPEGVIVAVSFTPPMHAAAG